MIGWNILYIVAGIIGGVLLGLILAGYLFKLCCCKMHLDNNKVKFVLMMTVAVVTPYFCYVIDFKESKYIGIIFLGIPASECGVKTSLIRS